MNPGGGAEGRTNLKCKKHWKNEQALPKKKSKTE